VGSKAANLSHILALVWKSWAPSKVCVFLWKLLLDRIPTRMNLLRHGVLRDQEASLCVFCGVERRMLVTFLLLVGLCRGFGMIFLDGLVGS